MAGPKPKPKERTKALAPRASRGGRRGGRGGAGKSGERRSHGPHLPNKLRRELESLAPARDRGSDSDDEDDVVGEDVYEYEEGVPEEEARKNDRYDAVKTYEYDFDSDGSNADEDVPSDEGEDMEEDDDGDDDEEKQIRILKETTGMPREAFDGGKKKKQQQAQELPLQPGGGPVTIHDLMDDIQDKPGYSKIRKRVQQQEKKPMVVQAPMPKVKRDLLDRAATYKVHKHDISKWEGLVKSNREATTLYFENDLDLGQSTVGAIASKFEPRSTFEKQMAEVLRSTEIMEAHKNDGAKILELNKVDVEDVRERQNRLAKMRSLLFRHEMKAKRVKKIKSRTYHRLLKKDKRKASSADLEADPEAAEESAMKQEFKRAEERMTLKHKNNSKWAKRILKRGLSVQDEGTRDAITAQLQQHALLTRKMNSIKNDSSSSDESSDDDDEDDDGSNLEAKLLNKGKEKIRKVVEEDNAIPKSGVFSLPFMERAMKKRADATYEETRLDYEELEQSLRKLEDGNTEENVDSIKVTGKSKNPNPRSRSHHPRRATTAAAAAAGVSPRCRRSARIRRSSRKEGPTRRRLLPATRSSDYAPESHSLTRQDPILLHEIPLREPGRMSSRAQGEKGSQGAPGGSETAARTRPLSIQEILRRREKKAIAEAKRAAAEAKDAKEELQDYEKGKPSRSDSGRGHKARKDVPVEKESARDAPREDSRKDDVRHVSREGSRKDSARHAPREASKKDNLKDRPKDGSKVDDAPKKGSKKERHSARDDGQSAGKDKGSRSSHKLSTSTRAWPAESRDGNHGEIRARNGDAARSEYLKGPAKRWNGEPVHNDRIIESDKLRNEAKRKYDHRRPEYDQRRPDVDLPVLKKHDSARFKHYDRNDGRKEYGNPYHEEPRPKRRRSRSRDHDQGRRGRSVSLSPRAQRRSYHGHDRDNYPPGRKYAENDRHRTSGNGGHGGESYQRHESPLGGYSPRKRKTVPQDEQVSTKITPPAVRSPEKKPATWDQAPAGADQSNFFTTLKPIVSQTSSVSVSSSAPKPNPATTLDTILSGNSSSIDSVQLTQATRPLRRLHIENLTSSASEDMLIGCLNDFLLSSGGNHIQRSKQPCLSCTINKEKRHAFVEFLTPEDATAALSFDGKSFNGSTLKIRRPKDYIEMPHVAPKKPVEEEIKVTSDVVADSPHKIFIAGISGVLSSEMLMEIVSSFGQLATYRFVCNEDLGRRCAFLEYIDHSITNKACAGLNGMKLGGSIITAVQVFPNPLEVHNEASPFYGIPYSAEALLEEPTKVMQLKNVVDREEYLLLSKPELEEILEDVRMECARFGAVKSINIVEYPSSIDSITEDIVVEPKDGPAKLEPTECCANDNCAETATDCPLPSKSIAVPSGPMKITGVDPIFEGQDHKEPDTLCESDIPAAADQYTDLDDLHAGAAGPSLDQQMEAVHMDSAQADQDATAVGDIHARASGLSSDQPTEAVNMGYMQSDQDATAVGDIHVGTVGPTLDQQTEADHMNSMQADQDATAVGDIHATAADPTLDQQTEADHMDSTQADHHATALDDDSAVGEGHAGSKTLEICISTTTPGDVVQRSETENEQKSSNDVSESGAEKLPAADTRGDASVSDTIVLEAGSILVEFMRKEAACMAAHSLHGRSFGDRTVSAGYAPHDLYLQRYLR